MFQCHILEHEEGGMMGQFVVIEPGTLPPERIPARHEGGYGAAQDRT